MTEASKESGKTTKNDGILLSAIEARIIGVLMEKQRTTPDNYPLTLNALVQGCNQKTSREPVMQLEPGKVGHSLNLLRDRGLIHASFTARAERYDHKIVSALDLNLQQQAALCTLVLRGPQTLGELRTNTSRLADFKDTMELKGTLELLESRNPPLIEKLPRATGRREERYMHLLCGELPEESPGKTNMQEPRREASNAGNLEAEVKQLRAELDLLWRLTGLEQQRPDKK